MESLNLHGVLTLRHFDRPNAQGRLICEETFAQTITTVGKQWLVDVLQEIDAAGDALKWHQSGTGTTAAAAGDTALGGAVYSRSEGSQTEASAGVYRSVETINYTGTRSITEWGIFTTSTSGTMFARKTFAAKSVANGDSIQFTWDLTA